MKNASLVVVGSGIKFLSHLTVETKTYIEQSDIVLYLVNDPAMKEWIQNANASTESLDVLYMKFVQRIDCYKAITDHILEVTRKPQHVCVVLYGHPTMLAKPGLDAIRQAKNEGIFAKILPGISAEACLFSDLLIDPGSSGCQSFETTDFLIHRRKFDPTSHLILWQVDIIGVLNNPKTNNNSRGQNLLFDYLSEFYSERHEVILYEAAQYPGFEPRIETFPLSKLPEIKFSSISSLYIKPYGKKQLDKTILSSLELAID